jgi:hypothetical protein
MLLGVKGSQVQILSSRRSGFEGVYADMRTLVGVTSMWNSRPRR